MWKLVSGKQVDISIVIAELWHCWLSFDMKSSQWSLSIFIVTFLPGLHPVDQHWWTQNPDAATLLSDLFLFEQQVIVRNNIFFRLTKSSPMLDSDVTHQDGIGPDQPLYLSSTDSLQQFPLCQQKADDLIKTTCHWCNSISGHFFLSISLTRQKGSTNNKNISLPVLST